MENAENQTFNIGTDIKMSQEDVVKKITDLWNTKHNTNIEPEYKEGPDLKEIPEQYLNWSKLHSLDWHPRYSFEDGINEMI